MAEAALRPVKEVLGPRVEVQTADVGALQVTTAAIAALAVTTAKLAADAVDGTKLADDACNSEHYTDGSVDLVHEANEAKAESIVLFDWGATTLTSGAQLTNKRIFTNYTDRKLIFSAFDLVAFERASVTSGSILFASLDAGTTALAGISRTASLAGGSTTALTNGAQLSLASGASIRMRQSAFSAGTFSRFTKLIGHYRASAA